MWLLVARSTKAGVETPATLVVFVDAPHGRERSTKAGVETPATPNDRPSPWKPFATLNEGRSRNPGDTSSTRGAFHAPLTSAQRRPESKPRRHVRLSSSSSRCPAPLNEGRSRNPGDTQHIDRILELVADAQRRPESKPRRHAISWTVERHGAGGAQRRPESKPRRHPVNCSATVRQPTAQRRPESKPRRHVLGVMQ